jgi:hypothetical protein
MKIVTPAETEEIFSKWQLPLGFDAEERAELSNTIPVVDDSDRIIGFPTPVASNGLNILNLHRLLGVNPNRPPSFFEHPWYLSEGFMTENCSPGWHCIQMDVMAESIEKPFNYYHSLSPHRLGLPTAIEVILMTFLHFELAGERLLLKKHTWCSNSASLGRMVTVGAFGRNGVFISGHPPDFASRGLGICGKLLL